jgi:RNA polymerase sigma factor (sigma-70 family)
MSRSDGMADPPGVRSLPGPTALCSSELADPELRRSLSRMARRGVPPHEVEDIVQEALTEALTARVELREPRHLRGWLGGVIRHKVVDFHRRNSRETLSDPPDEPRPADEGTGRDLLRWAEGNLPGGKADQQTFEWLLREGDGERLEEIARSEEMPAERVRQRVTRLRRHLRERWAAELAAALAAACFLGLLWAILAPNPTDPIAAPRDLPAPPRSVAPAVRAHQLRLQALEHCAAGSPRPCLDGLDQAAALDPDGDQLPEIQRARRQAERSLSTPPPPSAPPPAPPASQGSSRFGKINPGRITSDTAPQGRCVCPKGDPLCSCF